MQNINNALQRIPHTFGLLAITLLMAACGSAAKEEEGHAHGEEEGHKEGTIVELSAQQFAAIDGRLGSIEQKDLTTALKATGALKVPPQNVADVSSAMGGTVRDVMVYEGDAVRKGQVLATVYDQGIIDLQRNYLDAQARLVFATTDLERQTELAGANVAAKKTLQQAIAEHASLKATSNADAAMLRLINIEPDDIVKNGVRSTANVVSPIDGTVARVDVNVGSKATGASPMFRVVNNSKLHVDLFLYEQDIEKVKVGQLVDITLTNLPGESYTAVVFAIGNAFESSTKTIPVHAEITGNKHGLIDGMVVTARIDVGQARTPAVPTDAIVSNEGKDYVFIRTAEEAHDHDAEEGHAHAEEAEHQHAEGEAHDHEKENPAAHAKGEDHDHDHADQDHKADTPTESLAFKRVQVKRGPSDGGYTGITFMEPVPNDARIAVGGAFYLIAMMNTSEGHEH